MAEQSADATLLRMPFDQYGRYRMVQEAVTAAAAALQSETLTILDVGGYYQEADGTPRLPSQQFLGQHELTVLDLPDCDLPGYVQGDGTALMFADASFDLVISCDTLEHIPGEQRERFLGELLRVARYGVLLICPMYDERTVLAEQLLDAYIRTELHAEHDQLREHREYGLPQIDATGAVFSAADCCWREYPSGDLHAWLAMMLAKHYLLRFGGESPDPRMHYGLDELYNRDYALRERREPAYRRLLVVARDASGNWADAVDQALEPTVSRENGLMPDFWPGRAGQVLGLIQLGLADRLEDHRANTMHGHITVLQQIIADQQRDFGQILEQHRSHFMEVIDQQRGHFMEVIEQQRGHFMGVIEPQRAALEHQRLMLEQKEARIMQLYEQIRDMEARANWLQGQADALRRQLEAVENGMVMRLLQRIKR